MNGQNGSSEPVKRVEEVDQKVTVNVGQESMEPLLDKHIVQMHGNGRVEEGLTPIMEVDSSNGSHS